MFKAPSTVRTRTLVSWPAKLPVCGSGLSGNAVARVGMQSLPQRAQQIPHGKSKLASQIHKQKNHPFIHTWFSKYPDQIKFELFLFTVGEKRILEKEQCSLAWEILNNCALKPKKRILCAS